MNNDMPKKQLKILSEDLGLEYEEQDWGIINADGRRVAEFVNVYTNCLISKKLRYQLFELILASANDALEENLQLETTLATLAKFLDGHRTDFPYQLAYWTELTDEVEFPLSKHLRNWEGGAGSRQY